MFKFTEDQPRLHTLQRTKVLSHLRFGGFVPDLPHTSSPNQMLLSCPKRRGLLNVALNRSMLEITLACTEGYLTISQHIGAIHEAYKTLTGQKKMNTEENDEKDEDKE